MDTSDIDGSLGGKIMILKGSQRSGAKALADHLMNDRDNDHVSCLELRGFLSDQLHGALAEMHAISNATHCKQFMFSLSLNPPTDHIATEQDFLEAADRAEQQLGLSDQPRAIVVHEKEGRRHAHVVWSRIDVDEMKAINLPHFKNKLRDLSRDLFLDHGWVLPDGLATYGNKSPLNFTLEEWQQAKRQGLDPREIKQAFQQAWERSDSQIGFQNALEERGYFLARGDRRGFVALDVDGNVHSIAKWTGLKAKEVNAKLGSPDTLPSVNATRSKIRSKVTDQMRGYIGEIKDRQQKDMEPLRDKLRNMNKAHCIERQKLKAGQDKRWADETKVRSERLNKGLRGLFDRLSGKAKSIRQQNELDARKSAKRDQKQRDFMVVEQMKERRALQREFRKLRRRHADDRKRLASSVRHSLNAHSRKPNISRHRKRGPDLSLSL
ncbi:MAG: relaxase/mobilization nuclease domain-containing protein [Cellvibrionaceae bacterium]|nr:relaxase/mobilization nuclease domain-containing protein [Cellvibrionaceae bacterium]